MRRNLVPRLLIAAFLSRTATASEPSGHERAGESSEANPDPNLPRYSAPLVEGLHFAETFDGDVLTRWASSIAEKYGGKFEVARRKKEALVGDVGLLVPQEARHYGIATKFAPVIGRKEASFVVQFEVRFQDGLSCGGSYLKLYDSDGKEASAFDGDTPYVIMFGPDRCGNTDKVHFILKHRSPKTGLWEEKHMKDAPRTPPDTMTHMYGLVLRPDNTFDIQIDGETKVSGNLLTSMEPAINPPKEIDDPTDSKPSDWVDEAHIDDPDATKPDDWDEDEPPRITDAAAVMPQGWNEDATRKIPDPSAKKPEDWDNDEDGEWEAPLIDNPDCKVGCGKWVAPTISNPKYKGKWKPPNIDNPAYKGIWKARLVENPNFFVDEEPAILPKIDAVGIDIWTMSKGIIFDNIVIATDDAKAKAFAEQTFHLRKAVEKTQNVQESKSLFSRVIDWVGANYIAVSLTLLVTLISTSVYCQRSSAREQQQQEQVALDKDEADGQKEKPETKDDDTTENESKEKKEEGGLGSINDDE